MDWKRKKNFKSFLILLSSLTTQKTLAIVLHKFINTLELLLHNSFFSSLIFGKYNTQDSFKSEFTFGPYSLRIPAHYS